MGGGSGLPAPASANALALLRFPDRRTTWAVVMAATLGAPANRLEDRLAALHRSVPMIGARLHGEVWHPGSPPEPLIVDGEPLVAPELIARFDLAAEPPLRVVIGSGGRRLAVACHHAEFDGLGLLALLTALVGGEDQESVDRDPGDVGGGDVRHDQGGGVGDDPGGEGGGWGPVDSRGNPIAGSPTLPLRGPEPRDAALDPTRTRDGRARGVRRREAGVRRAPELRGLVGRLVRPADRVAPSLSRSGREALVVREVDLAGAGVTARLVDAAVAAAGARNQRLGRPWRRVGVNIGLAGLEGGAGTSGRGVGASGPGADAPQQGPGASQEGPAESQEGPAESQEGPATSQRLPVGVPGNSSRYRRVDLTPGEPAGPALAAALMSPREPLDQVWSPRFGWVLEPVVGRFSDSLLVSNLGRREVPGVTRLDFFPVARGRSAVAVGAVGLAGGPATVSVRARDLSSEDAGALLADLVDRLVESP
jgi:hypothetical protein